MLTGHQGLCSIFHQSIGFDHSCTLDVVPVNPETIGKWEHPPYSGHFDGERIWGRGTADDKNDLIATLSVPSSVLLSMGPDVPDRAAVEYLVSAGFEPARTLVLAFGFDEESSGAQACTFPPNEFDLVLSSRFHRVLGLYPSICWPPSAEIHSR